MGKAVQQQNDQSDRAGVSPLTASVNPTNRRTVQGVREALMAADIYAIRLAAGLTQLVDLLRSGDTQRAFEAWGGAERGIHSLAEMVHGVVHTSGGEPPEEVDLELGRLALGLHAVSIAHERHDSAAAARAMDDELVPALGRLADALPLLAPAGVSGVMA